MFNVKWCQQTCPLPISNLTQHQSKIYNICLYIASPNDWYSLRYLIILVLIPSFLKITTDIPYDLSNMFLVLNNKIYRQFTLVLLDGHGSLIDVLWFMAFNTQKSQQYYAAAILYSKRQIRFIIVHQFFPFRLTNIKFICFKRKIMCLNLLSNANCCMRYCNIKNIYQVV